MSQAGFTPIQLYFSTTAAATPSAGNLANGELALNITDGKLFYKDNGGVVQVLASKDANTGTFTNATVSGDLTLSGGTANGVAYLNGSKVLTTGSALVFDGANFGVGTSNPAAFGLFAINGASASANINASTGSAALKFYEGSGTGRGSIASLNGSDGLAFLQGTTEGMRLTSTGLGIGTSSPAFKLDVAGTLRSTGIAYLGDATTTLIASIGNSASSGVKIIQFQRATGTGDNVNIQGINTGIGAADFGMQVSGGKVGIGTSSPSILLTVGAAYGGTANTESRGLFQAAGNAYLTIGAGAASDSGVLFADSGANNAGSVGYNHSTNALTFGTSATERARIDSSGNFVIGDTGADVTDGVLRVKRTGASYVARLQNTNASTPSGLSVFYSGGAPNGTASPFIFCEDSSALRMSVRSNGGIANFSGNDVNLSDRREKTNFAPAKSYLETICAIPVQTFNYIDQNNDEDPGLTLGVVAQDVQAVAPELVMESDWGTKDDPKMRLSIYQTDLQYALMKCIQEQQALIQTLTARVTALESN